MPFFQARFFFGILYVFCTENKQKPKSKANQKSAPIKNLRNFFGEQTFLIQCKCSVIYLRIILNRRHSDGVTCLLSYLLDTDTNNFSQINQIVMNNMKKSFPLNYL